MTQVNAATARFITFYREAEKRATVSQVGVQLHSEDKVEVVRLMKAAGLSAHKAAQLFSGEKAGQNYRRHLTRLYTYVEQAAKFQRQQRAIAATVAAAPAQLSAPDWMAQARCLNTAIAEREGQVEKLTVQLETVRGELKTLQHAKTLIQA